MNLEKGYIKLFRQIINWEWYTDIPVKVLFLHLLLKVNHKPEKWRGLEVSAGQLVTSYGHLAKETGLTLQQVRTALNKLKSTQEVTYKSTSHYSIISIKNWNKWQETNTICNNQITNNQQTNNKQVTTNKNDKNDKNDKKERIDCCCNQDFEKCFKIYSENCKNLLPLSFERRSRNILELLKTFLIEINYDFDYFKGVCIKANDLKTIVNNKIDFKSLLNNHIGIMNGKYKTPVKQGVSQEFIDDFFNKRKGVNNE